MHQLASIYVNITANLVITNERLFRMAERHYLETIIIQLLERNAAEQAEHQADEQFHHFHQEVPLEVKRWINKIFLLTLKRPNVQGEQIWHKR